jgi:translation initiation factor IF-2
MTADNDFKQIVRERAAKTGESYQTARRQLERQRDRFSARAVGIFQTTSGRVLACVIEAGEVTRGMTVAVATGDGSTHDGTVASLRHMKQDLAAVRFDGPFREFGLLLEPAYVGSVPARISAL